jgi:hypothetical protein
VRNNKAPGMDNIPIELNKKGEQLLKNMLHVRSGKPISYSQYIKIRATNCSVTIVEEYNCCARDTKY